MKYIEKVENDINLTISKSIIMNGQGQRLSDWIFFKKRIQLYAVYRRHTLDAKAQIENQRVEKKQYAIQKIAGVSTLTKDKTIFRTRNGSRNNTGERGILNCTNIKLCTAISM